MLVAVRKDITDECENEARQKDARDEASNCRLKPEMVRQARHVRWMTSESMQVDVNDPI